jgi:hypothetical protein
MPTVDERLGAIEAKLDRVITVVEVDRRANEAFDDRIAAMQDLMRQLSVTEKNLASATLRLAAAKAAPSLRMMAALIVAALLGGTVATFAHDAMARRPNVELHSQASS